MGQIRMGLCWAGYGSPANWTPSSAVNRKIAEVSHSRNHHRGIYTGDVYRGVLTVEESDPRIATIPDKVLSEVTWGWRKKGHHFPEGTCEAYGHPSDLTRLECVGLTARRVGELKVQVLVQTKAVWQEISVAGFPFSVIETIVRKIRKGCLDIFAGRLETREIRRITEERQALDGEERCILEELLRSNNGRLPLVALALGMSIKEVKQLLAIHHLAD
jgi:hypothetical protein